MKGITEFREFDDHELLTCFSDKKSGLRGFIAIHNTNLGPATGGTRYWHYRSERDALHDVLRLSKAMTYKCALARVPHGGGKGVIMANSNHHSKKEFLEAYAKRINLLNGSFYTGEDVGLTKEYVETLARHSRFIIGRERFAGNPSPWAAKGVFYAMEAALEAVFGSPEIQGHTFAIRGVGKVGEMLCNLLYDRGGEITIADINSDRIKSVKRKFPRVSVVSPAEIHKQRVDVYAPCALGDEFNKKTIPQLRSQIICGGANNQLSSSEDGNRLHSWGILYIPDYLANAGGLINVVAEIDSGGYSRRKVERKVKGIKNMAKKIIELSVKKNQPTSEVADRLAEEIFLKKKP
ncbi:MAG: Glu/Leu/Phe/Val dehydrogenase dimerization domain-containing protein [Patescibacteria group bacterium]